MYRLRTVNEIVRRHSRSREQTGWEREVLAQFIPVVKFGIETVAEELTVENVSDLAATYLDYAWSVVLAHKNVPAQRSAIKLNTYCWVLGAPYREFYYYEEGRWMINVLQRSAEFLNRPCPPFVRRLGIDGEKRQMSSTQRERIARLLDGQPCRDGCAPCLYEPPEAVVRL